ncbi:MULTISPECIES: hypothetical protein [unclassified Amycolatopsis]|uniref:hypothetical protein n=1 Tax=unclassified Amycolatopsis TaxID=2618356 RepID=UPI00287438E6|nr:MULTISPECIES: hypothetical protein [unclassified Amycolatopsis]MDS0137943.1 hypothetical protein [Amycolatopsis sp. 505]MDS0144144.1 hypothetical protein [Amycolatopsis sp. CM201R]
MSGAYLLQAAKPPVPAILAAHVLSAFREQWPSAPGGATAHHEQTRISPAGKQVPEPRALTVAAFARGRVLVACRERAVERLTATLVVARPLSPFRPGGGLGADKLRWARAYLPPVARPLAPAVVAIAAAGLLSAFSTAESKRADESRRARAYLRLIPEPPSSAMAALVARRELMTSRDQTVEPLRVPGSAFVVERGLAAFQAVESGNAFSEGRVPMPAVRERVAA